MDHYLKTDPEVFQAVWDGKKNFEIRYDDRKFQENDVLILVETKFTGQEMKEGAELILTDRKIVVRVDYILRGPIYGLMDGWCIMAIKVRTMRES